jgi:hypothetical protein
MRRALLPLAALTLAVPVLTFGYSDADAKPRIAPATSIAALIRRSPSSKLGPK